MIGSGWIGMELAAAASSYGNNVTLLGLEDIPLAAAIGPELGRFFRSLHEANGVQFRLPASAREITGHGRAVTGSGHRLGRSAAGRRRGHCRGRGSRHRLAGAAGLALDNGILTDASLRTSAPDIFAAGDVANALHPFTGQHHRSEHWSNALNGGKVAAKSMLGQDATLDTIPYFYTDQFDVSMEYSGFPTLAAGAEPVIRGSLEAQGIHRLLAAGRPGGGRHERQLAAVRQPAHRKPSRPSSQPGARVQPSRLADPAVPLDQLLPDA